MSSLWLRTGNGGARVDTRTCCDGKCAHGERCPAIGEPLIEQEEHDYRPGLYLAAATALVGWVGFIALVRWLA
jgi:hypothetical protein